METRTIVAHGGAMGGYTLFVADGIPAYCYNLLAMQVTCVRAPSALLPGRHEVRLSFRPDQDGGATVTLQADAGAVAEQKIPRLTPFVYEASDGFSVGVDAGSQVVRETHDAPAAAVELVQFQFPVAGR